MSAMGGKQTLALRRADACLRAGCRPAVSGARIGAKLTFIHEVATAEEAICQHKPPRPLRSFGPMFRPQNSIETSVEPQPSSTAEICRQRLDMVRALTCSNAHQLGLWQRW
jgi:hypothetical protein